MDLFSSSKDIKLLFLYYIIYHHAIAYIYIIVYIFVILWNGMDLNLRRRECKVLVIFEIPRDGIREWFAKITHICLHQICLFLVLYCDNHVWSEQWFSDSIQLCVDVIESDGVLMLFTSRIDCTSDLQVRIHTYTRCLSHIRVPTHVRPGTVCQREKYIYLKTVSQLSKFVQSVLFTDIYSINIKLSNKAVLN